MSHRCLNLVVALAVFSAQFLSVVSPAQAMPSPIRQAQPAQTITLNGRVLAYAINDPAATIDLANADIAINAVFLKSRKESSIPSWKHFVIHLLSFGA